MDIVIIGAGPIGCYAAQRLADFDVLILESKTRIGYPKQCAEAISESSLTERKIKIKKNWVNKGFDRADVISPSGRKIQFDISKKRKLVLERKIFDPYMADLAVQKGAKLRKGCKVISISEQSDGVLIEYLKGAKKYSIRSRLVILATGVDNRLAKDNGLLSDDRSRDIMKCFQYEMDGLECSDSLSLYFGSAPGGYIWIFPKSRTKANIGIGVTHGNPKRILDDFIKNMGGRIIEKNAGLVPLTAGQVLNKGRIFLVGDAARAVNPIHGGGLNTGLKSADIVADAIIESYDGKFDSKILRRCNKDWQRAVGRKHRLNYRLKEFIFSLSNKEFNRFFDAINQKNVYRIYESNTIMGLIWTMLKTPRLYPLLWRLCGPKPFIAGLIDDS